MAAELGIVEGFYGPLWSWEQRRQLVRRLAPHGYGFYLYAPKADAFLRRRWREPHPLKAAAEMADFARFCKTAGVRFGVGLSPFELFNNFDESGRQALALKLAFFDQLGLDELAILFDDMRGAGPQMAQAQADIVHWIAEHSAVRRISMCPTYYSDDPILDRVFGQRPADYLQTLGQALDGYLEILRLVRIGWYAKTQPKAYLALA